MRVSQSHSPRQSGVKRMRSPGRESCSRSVDALPGSSPLRARYNQQPVERCLIDAEVPIPIAARRQEFLRCYRIADTCIQDPEGTWVVALHRIAPRVDGQTTSASGDAGLPASGLYVRRAVAVDSRSAVYVAEGNNRVLGVSRWALTAIPRREPMA